MAATATPKQGDHVFNDVGTAIMRPFETLMSLRSDFVEGKLFVYDYLLQTYSMAKHLSSNSGLAAARRYTASTGDESQAIREFARLSSRYPVLGRLTIPRLRDFHSRNSDDFGHAAERFYLAVLTALQRSLEKSISNAEVPLNVAGTPSPGLTYQGMLDAAYDPAAALILITDSMSRETTSIQSSFSTVIRGIAETLDRPGMWKDPYVAFREDRPSATGKLINGIRIGLSQMDLLKAPGSVLATLIAQEVLQNSRSTRAQSDFGAMLHLVQTNLQQRRGAT